MTISKGLFGGALVAAGMSAQARTFVYSAYDAAGATQSYAFSYAPYETYDYAFGPDLLNTSTSDTDGFFGTNTFSTTQTATSMRASGRWEGDGSYGAGFGSSYILQFFQVSADAQLLIEWDFSATDNLVSADVFVDAPGGASLFSLDPSGDAVGSAIVNVEAGVAYGIDFGLIRGFGPFLFDTNEKFIEVTLVPGPGVVGVLALAGLLGGGASRRRR